MTEKLGPNQIELRLLLTGIFSSVKFDNILVEFGMPAGKCSKSNRISTNLESNKRRQLENKSKFKI